MKIACSSVLFILIFSSTNLSAQEGFHKQKTNVNTTDQTGHVPIPNKVNQTSNLTLSATANRSDEDLYFNFNQLPSTVKEKINQNKVAGISISEGIYKGYDLLLDNSITVSETIEWEKKLKKISGFVSLKKISTKEFKIIVNPFVKSEGLKEVCNDLTIGFSFNHEYYFIE